MISENPQLNPPYREQDIKVPVVPINEEQGRLPYGQQYYYYHSGYDEHQYVQYIHQPYYRENDLYNDMYIVNGSHGNSTAETTSKIEQLRRRE